MSASPPSRSCVDLLDGDLVVELAYQLSGLAPAIVDKIFVEAAGEVRERPSFGLGTPVDCMIKEIWKLGARALPLFGSVCLVCGSLCHFP